MWQVPTTSGHFGPVHLVPVGASLHQDLNDEVKGSLATLAPSGTNTASTVSWKSRIVKLLVVLRSLCSSHSGFAKCVSGHGVPGLSCLQAKSAMPEYPLGKEGGRLVPGSQLYHRGVMYGPISASWLDD